MSLEDEGDDLERARRFVVRCWQACGSILYRRAGWDVDLQGATGTPRSVTWQSLPERLRAVAERLRGVQIENRLANDLLPRCNAERVLLYCDPPYVPGSWDGGRYQYEMTTEEHRELLCLLVEHRGPVVLSGYDNGLYRELLGDWQMVSVAAKTWGAGERCEVLWLNPVAATSTSQQSLALG